MKNYKITTLKSNKNISIIRPVSTFSSYLTLELVIPGQEALESFEWGFVDLYYQTLDGFPECKRVILSYQDFLEGVYSCFINCGEYLYKIRVGSFFFNSNSTQYKLKIKLKTLEKAHIDKSIRLTDLHEKIMLGPTIEFMEILRAFPTEKFFEIIPRELDNLEARIDEASGRSFNFGSLLDTIAQKSNAIDNDNLELNLFGIIYSLCIAANKSRIELMFPNLIIDFDSWENNSDGTGLAKIWIEPPKGTQFVPPFKSPFETIEIGGVVLIVEVKKNICPDGQDFIFEIYGLFNPEKWSGRSCLNLQSCNEDVTIGYNRIIHVGSKELSTRLLENVAVNLSDYLFTSFKFYFSQFQNIKVKSRKFII